MSAFMMSNETLSMLAEIIHRYHESGGEEFGVWFPTELFIELGGKAYYKETTFKALADLNVQSLKERYGDDVDDMIGEVDFISGCDIWEPDVRGIKPWHYQVLKSLDCYLYQSCEGKCYQDPLYKALEKLRDKWGCYIAEKQPGYELADWK